MKISVRKSKYVLWRGGQQRKQKIFPIFKQILWFDMSTLKVYFLTFFVIFWDPTS